MRDIFGNRLRDRFQFRDVEWNRARKASSDKATGHGRPYIASTGFTGCEAGFHDIPALVAEGRRSGTLAVPLVAALGRQVAAHDAGAAVWVHWGSTSQDVQDSAMVLATREALRLLDDALDALSTRLLALGRRAALLGDEDSRLTPDELREVLMQSAIYAGVPAANTAFSHATAILREVGPQIGYALDAASPLSAVHPGAGAKAAPRAHRRCTRACAKRAAVNRRATRWY
jgi:hypothetical protein